MFNIQYNNELGCFFHLTWCCIFYTPEHFHHVYSISQCRYCFVLRFCLLVCLVAILFMFIYISLLYLSLFWMSFTEHNSLHHPEVNSVWVEFWEEMSLIIPVSLSLLIHLYTYLYLLLDTRVNPGYNCMYSK